MGDQKLVFEVTTLLDCYVDNARYIPRMRAKQIYYTQIRKSSINKSEITNAYFPELVNHTHTRTFILKEKNSLYTELSVTWMNDTPLTCSRRNQLFQITVRNQQKFDYNIILTLPTRKSKETDFIRLYLRHVSSVKSARISILVTSIGQYCRREN